MSYITMLHTFLQEEFEDSTGNVVNKRIYDDLKRQGAAVSQTVQVL